MRNAAIISAGLHVTAITLTVVGLPSLFDSERAEVVPIAVELVRFIEVEKPPPEPKAKQGRKPEIRHDPPPPPSTIEPPPQPIPEPVAEPAPPEPMPKPVAEPAPPEPMPKPVVKPAPKPKVKPQQKLLARKVVVPQPKRKPPSPPDQFQKLLKNLDQQKKREAHKRKRVKEPPIASVAPPPPAPPLPRPPSPLLIAALIKEVERQVWPCFTPLPGAKNAQNIKVGVRIHLTPDGHLNGEPQVEDSKRMHSDHTFRAVAESALRALRDPRCSPIKLPIKSFETWRQISFNFDPRKMLRR